MLRIVLFGLLVYFIYRFVFDLLLPLLSTARRVQRNMQQMQQQMNAFQQQPNGRSTTGTTQNRGGDKGEYIDFEEIK
jgi:Flp pilus assembly protein TadB